MNRFRAGLTAAVAVALTAAGLTAGQPAWAASCHGSGCTGQDPQATGCSSGATTIASASDPGGTLVVQVRYSATCGTYWARSIVNYPSDPGHNEAILYGFTRNPGFHSYTEDSHVLNDQDVWSPMGPTGYWVYACTDAWINGVQLCTGVTGSGQGPN